MTETMIQAPTNTTAIPAVVARKRRREILSSQRTSSSTSACTNAQPQVSLESQNNDVETAPLPLTLSPPSTPSCPSKKQKLNDKPSATGSQSKTTSKPKAAQKKKANTQMRYDPDVPMTKEEAAAWRREARRVRNRESAAASRQKTRDRIVQLEGEVDMWKRKYEEVMSKLRLAEGSGGGSGKVTSQQPSSQSWSDSTKDSSFVSPCSSPSRSPELLPSLSSLCPSSLAKTKHRGMVVDSKENGQHLTEKISRPAVKIAGAVTSILDLHPDSVVSATADMTPASLVVPESGQNEDGDLEDFLLDALEGLEQEKEIFTVSS